MRGLEDLITFGTFCYIDSRSVEDTCLIVLHYGEHCLLVLPVIRLLNMQQASDGVVVSLVPYMNDN